MQTIKSGSSGTLYIVPTPIGNLEDITARAIRILREVSHVCAEDTRHTRKLLSHFGISTSVISYYREKEREKSVSIVKLLHQGKDIALVSDAGTPAISDPGAILVQHARQAGIKIVPLPGACAATTALSAAGMTDDGFLFLGFAPSKQGQRKKFLQKIKNCSYPVVLYESPRRVGEMLTDALAILGDRQGFWARELTKTFEDLQQGSLSELVQLCEAPQKGEFVIIIYPETVEEAAGENLDELLVWYRDNSDLSLKDVSKKLSSDLGLSRSEIYKQALKIWNSTT
ncbi:16S rRNA (cytidine(1402)-2'-O)-methyltransferase [Desulforhopalus singaporensis]|nr:16S rRNA (cytidine(1402)-2'-O)-methyltransferase [Desulforhopalus singaporensis]